MSVANVQGAIHLVRTGQTPGDAAKGDAFARLLVGEQLLLNVVRQVDQRTYLVSFGGEQHVMESSFQLPVGARIRAQVVAVGDRLELQYVDIAAASATGVTKEQREADVSATPPTLLAALERRYQLSLDSHTHAQLEQAVAGAADPTAMALGGLFLNKLGVTMNDPALQALHDVQRDVRVVSAPLHVTHRDISSLVASTTDGDASSTQELAQALQDCVPEAPAQSQSFDSGGAGSDQSDARDARDLAALFLNLQDGGSVAYRYGCLPVIVAGQLIELDLVVLQQQPQAHEAAPVRRLVMTLKTESFGQVRVDARALDNRLIVTISGEAARSADALAAHKDEVRELLTRLGWNVEAIGYELEPLPGRAARQVIDHVLSAGTVDLVF